MARKTRDHYAPKRNVSAFVHYQNAMRDSIKSRFPGISVSDFAKLTSDMYEQLPNVDKLAWESCSKADKQRFDREMELYEPPPGYDAKGNATMENLDEKRKRLYDSSCSIREVKLKPSPGCNTSGNQQYLGEMNAAMAFPALVTPAPVIFAPMNTIAFEGGREENEFTRRDAVCQTFYLDTTRNGCEKPRPPMFAQDFPNEEETNWEERVLHNNFGDPPIGEGQGQIQIAFTAPAPVARRRGRPKKRKDKNAPKRCRTAFVLYASEERPKILIEFPGISFVDMGSILGKRWRERSTEVTTLWEGKAAEDKVRYFQEMEEYKALLNTANPDREQSQKSRERILEMTPNVTAPLPVSGYSMHIQQLPSLSYGVADSQLLQMSSQCLSNSDENFYSQGLPFFEARYSV